MTETGICLVSVLAGFAHEEEESWNCNITSSVMQESDMNFTVFSDDPCRVSYVESIAIPIGHTQVQLYGIEPGARTKWIVVKQLDGPKATLKVFLRQNEKFLENQIDDLPLRNQKPDYAALSQLSGGREVPVRR